MKPIPTNAFYGNIMVLSMMGDTLFRCNEKRALWYINRDLATWVNEHTIQFNFSTKGDGHKNDPFYTAEKKNVCVVCGSLDDLSKHHVVPKCYRKHLSNKYKAYASHDVLLLCTDCHHKYEEIAEKYKKDISKIYLDEYQIIKLKQIHALNYDVIGAAKTLLKFKDKLPDDRREFLIGQLSSHYDGEITFDVIKKISSMVLSDDDNFSKRVADTLENDEDKVFQFYVLWREHFIETMKPQHLPYGWHARRPFVHCFIIAE